MAAIARKTTLRPAAPGDYPVIAALFRELGVGEELVPYERFCAEMLADTVVADDGRSVVGFAYWRPAREILHLANLVTAAGARRQGVGRLLMAEVMARGRLAGCSAITLNVIPSNAAAIRLYERSGLAAIRTNRHLKLPWSAIDALPPSAAPFAGDVKPVGPHEDDELEREHDLPLGILAVRRSANDRILRLLRRPGMSTTLGVFDPGYGLLSPVRAPDLTHALSLMHAIRPLVTAAAPEHVLLPIEGHPELADAFVAMGAAVRFDTLFMRGTLSGPSPTSPSTG